MEFRQLEYFYTISKLENFTRTAEALHVSQPSVTKAIKALEAELEMTLIDRRQKHVTLTTEGKAFLLHAEKILWAVDEARQDMLRFQKNKHGVIHFGVPPMMEAYLFPKLFTKFKEAYSNIEIDVREYGDSTEVLAKIESGELDMGMTIGSEEQGENSMLIMQDQMNLCVSNDHPLHDRENVDFRQLKNEKFILQQPNTYQYKKIYARCVAEGFTPDILLCTSQLKTIKQLVANNVGISLLLDLVTRQETIFKRVSVYPPMPVNISLVWSRNKCLSQAAESFVAFMEEYKHSSEFKAFLDEKTE